jgi:hypothetical protein
MPTGISGWNVTLRDRKVTFSTITHDLVANNSGGVLLSDDTGPTHGNLVTGN